MLSSGGSCRAWPSLVSTWYGIPRNAPVDRRSARHRCFCLREVAASPRLDNVLIGLPALRTQSDPRAATAFSGTLTVSSEGSLHMWVSGFLGQQSLKLQGEDRTHTVCTRVTGRDSPTGSDGEWATRPCSSRSLDPWILPNEQGHRAIWWPLTSGACRFLKDDTPTSRGGVSKPEPQLRCPQARGPPANLTLPTRVVCGTTLGPQVECRPLPALAVR